MLRIAQMRPTSAIGELRLRGVRLIQRLMRRRANAPDALLGTMSNEASRADRAYAAISGYRPHHYDGAITLIASSSDRSSGPGSIPSSAASACRAAWNAASASDCRPAR